MNEEDIHIESEDPESDTKADAKVKKLREEIESIRKERQEYLDGWQRAKADYVNAQKRFESDLVKARERGVMSALETLLPAYDALARAKEHGEFPPGFEAIAKQLESAFSSMGISVIGAVGDRFDPALHEALGQDEVESVGLDGSITVVLERGYRLGDHLIRPAKVRVGQGA